MLQLKQVRLIRLRCLYNLNRISKYILFIGNVFINVINKFYLEGFIMGKKKRLKKKLKKQEAVINHYAETIDSINSLLNSSKGRNGDAINSMRKSLKKLDKASKKIGQFPPKLNIPEKNNRKRLAKLNEKLATVNRRKGRIDFNNQSNNKVGTGLTVGELNEKTMSFFRNL